MISFHLLSVYLFPLFSVPVTALHIVIPGGTGPVGRNLSHILSSPPHAHRVTILTRNSFLASAPARVSTDFGWLGKSFLSSHPNVMLRDWDGGDLLDIVGKDWMGWQDDVLKSADVVVNLSGGFTPQRSMAMERIIRGLSEVRNENTLVVSISPSDAVLRTKLKKDRVKICEEMVESNCVKGVCLRFSAGRSEQQQLCEEVLQLVQSL
mmetsp:Transcript_49297/g.96430  ORF Transcript_49297/g.96430 Transcript_49297/m.96430 type:complete len:208 (+) Transcript_49297:60-683(+)